jgi:hypothetical protein
MNPPGRERLGAALALGACTTRAPEQLENQRCKEISTEIRGVRASVWLRKKSYVKTGSGASRR